MWPGGKHSAMIAMNALGMLVVQFKEKGGLNHVMRRFLFLLLLPMLSSSTLG